MKVDRWTINTANTVREIETFQNLGSLGSGGAAKSSISVQRRREHSTSE